MGGAARRITDMRTASHDMTGRLSRDADADPTGGRENSRICQCALPVQAYILCLRARTGVPDGSLMRAHIATHCDEHVCGRLFGELAAIVITPTVRTVLVRVAQFTQPEYKNESTRREQKKHEKRSPFSTVGNAHIVIAHRPSPGTR